MRGIDGLSLEGFYKCVAVSGATLAILACLLVPASGSVLPRAKPDVPALEIMEPTGPWAILSAQDIERYKRIFALQENGKMGAADSIIFDLDNDILLGHVLYQRYLHPTAWRSTYAELSAWMTLYSDHASASRIYNLAKKRRPAGASPLTRPQLRRWRAMALDQSAKSRPPRRPGVSKRRRIGQIKTKVRSLLRHERPTQALNYINASHTRRTLTTHEYDQMRQWIANSYYLENVDEKALALAGAVAKSNGKKVPLSYWTAGLASWRLGDIEEAGYFFGKLAMADYASPSNRSAGAWWAARAKLAQRKPEGAVFMLDQAAQYETSFYGLLAARQLGRTPKFGTDTLEVSPTDMTRALKRPGVARAIALAQSGEGARAEAEMRRVHGKSKSADDSALLALARHWHLPSAQLDIANHSDRPTVRAGLFPVPQFEPDGGFKLDRALLYAFMRQESKFDTRATSRVGARGLMQLMPKTAVHVSNDRSLRYDRKDRLYQPSFNMMLGQKYIQELMTRYKLTDNLFDLLIAYNGGPGNLRKWKKNTIYKDDPLLFIESIPSRETRGFLEAVARNFWMYRLRLGQDTPSLDLLAQGKWPGYIAIEGNGGSGLAQTLASADNTSEPFFMPSEGTSSPSAK